MKCILHIGSAKTGTTSLQSLLYDSRDRLARKGWIYPVSCLWRGDRSHNTLGIYFWDNFLEQMKTKPFPEVLAALMNEIKGWDNVLISSELMEKAIIHGNENTGAFLTSLTNAGYDLEVVYAIRRQDFFIDSMFKQSVADPYVLFSGTIEKFIDNHAPYIKYANIAEKWKALDGVSKLSIVRFLEGNSRDNIKRLLECMGHDDILLSDTRIPTLNKSLEGIYLRLKHYLNRCELSVPIHHKYNNVILASDTASASKERTSIFSDDERQVFLQRFADDFRRLSSEFGIDSQGWLNGPQSAHQKFVPLGDDDLPAALAAVDEVSDQLGLEIRTLVSRR